MFQIFKYSISCLSGFQGDPENKLRGEDDLIAWTFRRFLDDIYDPDILLYLPMVKVGVYMCLCVFVCAFVHSFVCVYLRRRTD